MKLEIKNIILLLCHCIVGANLSYKPVLEQHRQWILEKVFKNWNTYWNTDMEIMCTLKKGGFHNMHVHFFLKKNLYQKTEEEFQRNQQRLMSKSEDFHPSVIQNNLKVALMEAEEESENIVEQFLESVFSL